VANPSADGEYEAAGEKSRQTPSDQAVLLAVAPAFHDLPEISSRDWVIFHPG
jgi:hypothetical protein